MRDNRYCFKITRRIQVLDEYVGRYSSVHLGTYLGQDVLKRYLLSRIALRLLKIIEPYLVEQERMANAQLLRYGSKHLGQNFFFYFIVLDRFFPEEPSLRA